MTNLHELYSGKEIERIYKDSYDNNELNAKFGSIIKKLFNDDTKEECYKELEDLLNEGYSEAGVVLGQLYAGDGNRTKSKEFFKVAADANIGEGLWGYSNYLNHNFVPKDGNEEDELWVETVIKAAKLGCPDALNEAGNIEHRRKNYFLSAYWYGLAEIYGHPEGLKGCLGIAKDWCEAGRPDIPEEFKGNPYFEQGKLMILTDIGEDRIKAFENIKENCMNDDYNALKIFMASICEKNAPESAYTLFEIAAAYGDSYAKRALADMIMNGIGCKKNITLAQLYYRAAAIYESKEACFVVGEYQRVNGKIDAAISWYWKAHARGYAPAFKRIEQIVYADNESSNQPKNEEKDEYWRSDGKIVCLGDNCVKKECPDNCPIMLNTMGLSLISINQYQKAIETFKEAVKIAPDFIDVWANIGACYGLMNKHEEAYNAFYQAYKLDNNYAKALNGLEKSCKHLGRTKESKKWYKKLNKDNSLIYLLILIVVIVLLYFAFFKFVKLQ